VRATVVLAMVSGCHALWGIDDTQAWDAAVFDAPADATCGNPSGMSNDFDSDGIIDACDLCPQNPAPTTDMDGDGIGDECDPRPTLKDTRLAFYAFRTSADIVGWSTVGGGTWIVESTGLVQSDATATARIDVPGGPYASMWVETSITVLSVGAAPYAGACANLTGSDFHCCDADKSAQTAIIARSANPSTMTDYPGPIAPGHDLLLQNRSGTNLVTCTLSEGTATASATLSRDTGEGTVALHTRGMAVAYRYLFLVKLGS
jgi:hypothetical protein